VARNKINIFLAFLTASILLLNCGGSVKLVRVWSHPEYVDKKVGKVLVVALSHREEVRAAFEYRLREELRSNGIDAMASLENLPMSVKLTKENFPLYFKNDNIDAVLVTNLVSADTVLKYVRGMVHSKPVEYYNMWGYYETRWVFYETSSTLTTETEYQIESNMYETKGGALIWSGLSKAVNPDNAIEVINKLSKMLVFELKRME
jgi:hypothetical protein